MEPTTRIRKVKDEPTPYIRGRLTENGVECVVFVRGLAVRDDRDQSQFQQELIELPQEVFVPLTQVLK